MDRRLAAGYIVWAATAIVVGVPEIWAVVDSDGVPWPTISGTVVSLESTHDWVARRPWVSQFGIDYYLGVGGISMPLVLLTTVLSFLAMIASWNIERMVRGYCILFLILETGMVGTFLPCSI